VSALLHISGSHYLVGLSNKLIVWNEATGQVFLTISKDHVFAIQRVLTTKTFLVKTENSLKVLALPSDFNKSLECSMMPLLDAKDSVNYSHSLHHQVVDDKHILIATTENVGGVVSKTKKRKVHLIKIPIIDA
jgi:hypothetical protein